MSERYNVAGLRNNLNAKLDALLNEFETEKTEFHENEDQVVDGISRVAPQTEGELRGSSLNDLNRSIAEVEAEYRKVKDEDIVELQSLHEQIA